MTRPHPNLSGPAQPFNTITTIRALVDARLREQLGITTIDPDERCRTPIGRGHCKRRAQPGHHYCPTHAQ